ncbi:MAG: NfeD family protein [Rhodospirillaceae bacterium]|jgi:inner membrane protein|nr:NfeD family protein [Rhodospirillaceae bacterium]
MDAYIAWLWEISYWHWWAFAVLLIAIEILVPSTLLIWPAASAFVIGVAIAGAPSLDWRIQVLAFAVLAVVSTYIWQRWRQRRPAETDSPTLNLRGQSYIGRRLTLGENLQEGRGRIQLDDTWWLAESETGEAIAAGARVEIVAVESALLKLRLVPTEDSA